MRQHITQAEILQTNKFLRNGVSDIAVIQTQVKVHADKIQLVINKYNKQNAPAVEEPEVPEVPAGPTPAEAAKTKAAAKKAAAKVKADAKKALEDSLK